MPLKDLRAHYGKTSGGSREAINTAIRAECPGGDDALDALHLIKQMLDRHGWEDSRGRPTELCVAYQRVMDIIDAMEDAVRARWEMPERPPSDGLRRAARHS